ncbi:MAG: diguanylate cyclase [Methyloprofundus sp.]|nr:diguanylate cyclase [Methyloprofundus sp.]
MHRELISPFNDGEVIGKISLHASTNYNLEKAQQSAIFSIIISISLIGLTALIILLQVKRGVSSPLAYVSNTLHAIGTAKVKRISLLKQHENDELGCLCNDINSLLETLQTQFDAERSLREQIEVTEQQLRHIYNSSSAGLFVLNEQGYLLNYNSTFTAILNGPEELTKDATTEGLFESLLNQQSGFTLLVKQALSSANLETQDFAIVGEDNRSTPRWIHCLLSKLIDASGNVVLEGVIFDVTERVHKEQLIKRVAHYDELTGMLRRQPAKTQFESYIASNPSLNVGFVMMDLDGFKQINDSYGHLAGDQVLSIVAERLFKCVRTSDIVCRLGGDEFLIIIMNDNDVNLKQDIASKLLNRISQPISLEGDELVSVGVSIGITDLQLSNTKNFDKLIKDADKVMYQVKKNGKSNYQVKAQCLSKTATS